MVCGTVTRGCKIKTEASRMRTLFRLSRSKVLTMQKGSRMHGMSMYDEPEFLYGTDAYSISCQNFTGLPQMLGRLRTRIDLLFVYEHRWSRLVARKS